MEGSENISMVLSGTKVGISNVKTRPNYIPLKNTLTYLPKKINFEKPCFSSVENLTTNSNLHHQKW